jgi:ribonuclease Z
VKITFLGTSSGAPSRSRNLSGIALQLPQQSPFWLIDCGEGTQYRILESPLRLSNLERIFITHLHGDHLFGLVGMLASRSLQIGSESPVTLYGPAGLEAYVRCSLDISHTYLGYPIHFVVVKPGTIHEEEAYRVECAPMQHGIEAYGYAMIEREKPGAFDVEQARALGIPSGPLYGRLKAGETVTLPDGRTIEGTQLSGLPIPGRKVVFCGDTTFTPNAITLARGADVLVHEATFLQADLAMAERANHSTSTMAAEVARQAGVRTLLLTHFSARYESEAGSQMAMLLSEAQAIFPNTILARDFWAYEVPRRHPD